MTFNAGIEAAAKWHDDQIHGGHCGESTSEIIVRQRCNGWHKYAATEIRSLTRPSSSAPVEQREAVARIIDPDAFRAPQLADDLTPTERFRIETGLPARKDRALRKADAILSLPGPYRDEVLEEAAKCCEEQENHSYKADHTYDGGSGSLGYERGCQDVASAIRAIKSGVAK